MPDTDVVKTRGTSSASHASQTHRAFLCHQSGDKDFVDGLAHCLRSNGVEVFFDRWDVVAGDSIPEEIEIGLNACNLLLYVLSPAAIESKWARAEYHAFLFRKLNEGDLRIIPVLRKDCPRPPLIAPLKYIDFTSFDFTNPGHRDLAGDGPIKELLAAIYRTPTRPSLGEPHPSLASYEFWFQGMKKPPVETPHEYWEFAFKNLTDAPLHNFEFEAEFAHPVESVRYEAARSSANMTGGNELSNDRKTFHWLGNQIMENGWVVFVVRSKVEPVINAIRTKLLGREQGTNHLIHPIARSSGTTR